MARKLGELTAIVLEDGRVLDIREFAMRNEDGALVRGHMDVRGGGMVVFFPGTGRWEPEQGDIGNISGEQSQQPPLDRGRSPELQEGAHERDNDNPADRLAEDAAKRRAERERSGKAEGRERERLRLEQREREKASADAIARAAGEPLTELTSGAESTSHDGDRDVKPEGVAQRQGTKGEG